ncbi:MAG: hypothetical protein QM820_06890 [Minicystis sp.]
MSSRHEPSGPVAALMLPKTHKPLITYARAVHDHMLNNPNFPNPSPTLAVFAADIAAFEDAETQAASRAKGAAKARDARAKKVRGHLANLRHYVQTVADAQANHADAAAVIESAFMTVRKKPTRTRPELSIKSTGVSGSVEISARAVAHTATYYWQYSLDQQTWINAPDTMTARTVIAGLTSAQRYYFRFRALTRGGEIGYSHVVSFVVS